MRTLPEVEEDMRNTQRWLDRCNDNGDSAEAREAQNDLIQLEMELEEVTEAARCAGSVG